MSLFFKKLNSYYDIKHKKISSLVKLFSTLLHDAFKPLHLQLIIFKCVMGLQIGYVRLEQFITRISVGRNCFFVCLHYPAVLVGHDNDIICISGQIFEMAYEGQLFELPLILFAVSLRLLIAPDQPYASSRCDDQDPSYYQHYPETVSYTHLTLPTKR